MTGISFTIGDRLVGPVLGHPPDLVWIVTLDQAGLVRLEAVGDPGRKALRSRTWVELWMKRAL